VLKVIVLIPYDNNKRAEVYIKKSLCESFGNAHKIDLNSSS